MQTRTRQRGLSMLGFLFVAAVVVICVMIGFRVLPAYIEYYSVQTGARAVAGRRQGPQFGRRDQERVPEARRCRIHRIGAGPRRRNHQVKNEVTASASWTRKLPLVANVSLWLEFEASATR